MQPITILRQLNRRDFIKAGGMTALGIALGACAKNPVTGSPQFMLVSQEQEIAMDKKASPHQLSSDYGVTQDRELNTYVSGVGMAMASKSHRPDMPYSFQVVNANYVNAYAFPGGTIAATRGIMLEIDNEAELAALLGHEIGHVNARHTASRMSSQTAIGVLFGITGIAVGAKYGGEWGALFGGLGGIGAGLLLASYSRDDERQADQLGMEYMVRADYNPDGMIGLMDMLNEQHSAEPSALQVMFATHPMSSERLATARKRAYSEYASAKEYKLYRERYMDNTASLRAIGPVIKDLQEAEKLMGQKEYDAAEAACTKALSVAPDDYVGLLTMSKCQLAMGDYDEAQVYAAQARDAYPEEAQAMQLNGLLLARAKQYQAAIDNLAACEKALPGNPYVGFYKGYSMEGLGDRQGAATAYTSFLKQVNEGEQAKYAYARLVEWGYIKGERLPDADPFSRLA